MHSFARAGLVVLLLVCTTATSGLGPAPAPATDRPEIDIRVDGGRVSVHFAEAPLAAAVQALAHQFGFDLVVEGEILGRISLTRNDLAVTELLHELLRDCSWFSLFDSVDTRIRNGPAQVWIMPSPVCRAETVGDAEAPSAPARAVADLPSARDGLVADQRYLARVINGAEPADPEELLAMSRDARDASLKILSVMALGRIETSAARTGLIDALSDQNPMVRRMAVRGLGQSWGPAAVEPLANILTTETDAQVLREAITALARSGTDEALERLRLAEASSEPLISGMIRKTLDRIEGKPPQ